MDGQGGRGGRALPLTLLAAGTFLLTLAGLLAFRVVPDQTRTPLDLDGRIVCTGRGDVLDPDSLDGPRLRTDRDVPLSYRQQATVVEPSDADRITVELATTVLRTDRPEAKGLVQASLHRFTADRVTAMPVDDLGNGSIATEPDRPSTPVHVDGLELKFPVETRERSYPFYDVTARASAPIDYVDSTDVEGVPALHFHQRLEPVDLSRVDRANAFDLPASHLGLPGEGSVHVRLFYTVDRDYYVEPRTGTVVDAVERIDQYLGRHPDERLVTAFRFDARPDAETVDRQVAQARDGVTRIHLWGTVVPCVLAGAGLIALVVAAMTGARPARGRGVAGHPGSAARGA